MLNAEKSLVTCSCGEAYIGETIKNLKIRLWELSASEKSEVCKHFQH